MSGDRRRAVGRQEELPPGRPSGVSLRLDPPSSTEADGRKEGRTYRDSRLRPSGRLSGTLGQVGSTWASTRLCESQPTISPDAGSWTGQDEGVLILVTWGFSRSPRVGGTEEENGRTTFDPDTRVPDT